MKKNQIESWYELINIIDSEGFDYCFAHYSHWDVIEDKTFHKLKKEYLDSRNKLVEYVCKSTKKLININDRF